VHAAGFEFGDILGLENDIPAVDLGVGPKDLLGFLYVVANADGAPHIIDSILVAGIIDSKPLGHFRPGMGEVWQLGLIQLLEHPGLDLLLHEIGGRHHHVVAGLARQELGFQRIIGIESVVGHLDAGIAREFLQHIGRDVIGPVVDINALALRVGWKRTCNQRCGQNGGGANERHASSPWIRFWWEGPPLSTR
jgi:hypothetical protein